MDLKWAIAHDPCRSGDRAPSGAVPLGTSVRLVLRVDGPARAAIGSADLLVCEDGESWYTVTLEHCGEGYMTTIQPAGDPHVCFYKFALHLADAEEGEETLYYGARADGRTTAGELTNGSDGPGFQLTVYEPAFASPDWLAGAIMYQVFPDRFAQAGDGVRAEGLAYHEKMGRPVHLHESWDEPVEWTGDPDYDPIDFFGGTLTGIAEKLPYLTSLGVEVLYLNPVNEARSNHRYDTADYERIDPLLGDEEDFKQLVKAASEHGISIVLDAVLSHTGDDSRYFNAKRTYDSLGAAQGEESPFYSWYDFDHEGEETTYKSWWGFETLPEVDERDPSWQHYILGTPDNPGMLEKWLAAGARGYRLDVADEIPDDVLERIRTSAHRARGDVAIIGEVWEDATTKVSYGTRRTYALGRALDSVMNYPLRKALIGFALNKVDAYQLATFLKLQQANYPQPLYRCLMNLLSSHDVERIRSVLATGAQLKHLPRDKQIETVAAITPEQDARGAELQRMIAGLLYALPGAPCLYYGDERGMQSGGDPFCRATFPRKEGRADCGEDLTDYYRALGTLRKNSQILKEGDLACYAASKDVLYIVRSLPNGKAALIGINRSDEPYTIALDPVVQLGRMIHFESLTPESGIFIVTFPPRATTFVS